MTSVTEPITEQPTHRPRWGRRVAVAVVTVAVVAGGYGVYWWAAVQEYHEMQISATILYRSGNRDLRELRHTLDKDRIRTVVSLIDDRELNDPAKPQFKQEADYCRDHGIRLVRIPVKLGGWPTSDDVHQFLNVVADPANRPVLVHCAQGVRRTGMFMAAYQLSVLDRSIPWTKGTIQSFGHKPKDLDDIRTFIDNYDASTATVPTTMPSGGGE